MPIREQLSKKQIHYDLRRIRTGTGVAATGGGSAHALLSTVHTDTEVITPPDEGSLVLANATPLWDVLLHNDTAGSALVSDATTWTMNQTPTWTGRHSWSDGSVQAYVDEDGSADFNGHVAIGDGATVSAANALWVAEQFTDTTGTVRSVYGRLDLDPGASFDTAAQAVFGRVLIGTAQTQTGGVIYGARGYVTVDEGIAASDLVLYGVSGAIDVEDAAATLAVGVSAQTPIVDTGSITDAIGLYITDGAIGAGTKTNDYGIYISSISNGTNDWAIYSAGGNWDLDGGDLLLDNSYGIIHADGVTDGQILVANGTRYIPGDMSDIAGGDAQFVVMALSATLANERVLTAGDGMSLTDAGAGAAATVAVDLVAAWSGLEFSAADLRVDLDAAFIWTALHTFTATPAIEIDVASGDPVIVFDTDGADRFTLGVDDTDSDKFKINSGAALADPSDFELDSNGNVEIGGDFNLLTGKGIIHADGVTAGWLLVADGTRYVPANPAASLPIAPGGRGHIIRAEAGPVWASYAAATLGAVLIGDGTDITSDTTPTFVNTVTLDAGVSHSPILRFIGGTNDDTATLRLIEDVVAGNSDFSIKLVADDADARLLIRNVSGVTHAWIDAIGDASFEDIYIASGKGLIYADSVAAGMIPVADGTRYVPANPAASLPIAPGGRGHIIRAEAGPVWASYNAATLGAVLIGDGTDITSDTTPTFVNTVTLDAGVSHSPILRFIGGTNDDTATLRLIEDVVAGNSDFSIKLVADDADSRLMIRNATGIMKAWIDAVGAASFTKNVLINYSSGEVVSLKASGVAHGATTLTETDNFGQMILSSADGGLVIRGFLDTAADNQPIAITGILADTTSTTKSSAGRSLVELHGAQVTGTNFGNVVNDGNVVGFRVYTGGAWATTLISDENGGLWLPGTIDASDASIRVQMDDTGVTDAGPTDAELDGIFGTPATVGDGFFAFVDDGGTHARIFGCVSDGTNWWWQRWFIAA